MFKKEITLLFILIPIIVKAQDGLKPIIDVHLHGFTEESYEVIEDSPETFAAFKAEMKKIFKKYNVVYAVKSGGQYDEDMETNYASGV